VIRFAKLPRRLSVWFIALSAACGCSSVSNSGDGVGEDDAWVTQQHKPIMISASNYSALGIDLRGLGPFLTYAWATDPALRDSSRYSKELNLLQNIDEPSVGEMVVFSSHATLASKLANPGHIQRLKALGVKHLGYNSEGSMTPADEMQRLDSGSRQTNSVARFAALAESQGINTIWGPIRATLDALSDESVAAMAAAGLDGIVVQEQKYIEHACIEDRAAAIRQTAGRYRHIAGPATRVYVQIMPGRCLNGDRYAARHCGTTPARFGHCAGLLAALADDVDGYAIWASGPDDRAVLLELMTTLRLFPSSSGNRD
jgi:hypothetical protein